MNDQDAILAAILGMTDAVHLPCRNWTRPLPQNTAAARRTYQNGGIAWRPATGNDAQRKASERTLSIMADKGIISVHRRSGLRWPLVRLADPVDWATRLLAGLPAQEGAWLVGMELLKQSEEIPSWIPERLLMNDPGGKHEAMAIENMMLPLLVRGYAESGSTVQGEVRYMLTPEGAAWLGRTTKPKPDNGKEDPAACRIYDAAIAGELHRLASEKILDSRELGMIPLPASDCKTNCSQRGTVPRNDTGIPPENNRRKPGKRKEKS